MLLVLSAIATVAVTANDGREGAATRSIAAAFDLSTAAIAAAPRDRAEPLVPAIPANISLSDFDAPELALPLAENGPVFAVGAFGGRRTGMPKLAHVAFDWTF